MEILRVFNNNIVLARDAGREVIVTGRGVGFQTKPGREIDPSKVQRIFVPSDEHNTEQLAAILADISPENLQMVTLAMNQVGLENLATERPTVVIAVADHIGCALHRIKSNIHIEYPLTAEVRNLYPAEYDQADRLLKSINSKIEFPLPQCESVALALHLVNAGFATGDMSATYLMTGIIQQMVALIEQTYGITLDSTSASLGRLTTHLRYLFVRIHDHAQLAHEPAEITGAIKNSYPEAYLCAQRLGTIVELRLGTALTEDEISYLTLHVARVAATQPFKRYPK